MEIVRRARALPRRARGFVGRISLLLAVTLAVAGGLAIAAGAGWIAVLVFGAKDEPAAPLDITKVALVVAGGVGGAVALVVAYRRQRDLEQSRFIERFGAAATQLGSPYTAVRIAGVYAMTVVADESTGPRRQQCIDVLCGYLRLPYTPATGTNHLTGRDRKDTSTPDIEIEDHFQFLQNDKVVRQTIVRVIADHLRDHEHSWSNHIFDFTTAHFEDADFRKTMFSGSAGFDNATFSGDTRFDATTFSERAGFDRVTFSGDAWFGDAKFSGHAGFDKTTFSCRAGFDRATFSGDTRFDETTFSGRADFSKATFSCRAGFGEATFSGDTRFSEATFSGRAEFDKARFSSRAWFGEAKFSGYAGFSKARFSGRAGFSEATFSGDVGFGEATFSGDTRFIGATFAGDAWFGGATFTGNAWFDKATFSGDPIFDKATFFGDTRFTSVAFGASSTGGGAASFRLVNFGSGDVTFDQPRQWGPPSPVFDWDHDPSTKPANIAPTPWPPVLAP